MRTITVLDSATLGEDLDLSPLSTVGKIEIYANTAPEDVADRLQNSDVVVINKGQTSRSTRADLTIDGPIGKVLDQVVVR